MARKKIELNQLMMLGITPEAPKPARLDDVGFFDGHEVRMVHIDGVTWWVAADLCRALDLENVTKAMERVEEEDRMTLTTIQGHSDRGRGGARSFNVVNESGLYDLIFTSRKEKARAFKRWVTKEVLPAIRKYGFYAAGPRHARTMRRLGCDPTTAESRHDMTEGYKSFCRALAALGFKAPTHYAMATNEVYAAAYAEKAKGMRKRVGAARRSPLFDHMTRLALDVQRLMLSLLEEDLRERAETGEPGDVAEQIVYLRERAGEVVVQLLAVAGPDRALDVVDDPQRGRLWGVIQRQIGGAN